MPSKKRRVSYVTVSMDNISNRKTLFIKLLIEHIEISMIAILIAIIIGGIAGILISEFEKSAKITLGVINFYIRFHPFPCSDF
ncbi:MAG: hypothetical protein ACLVI9_05890 [Anaerostipes hadrus]